MLCTLAVLVTREGSFTLRISGNTAVGPSGTGGRDVKNYATANALFEDLRVFGLGDEIAIAASHGCADPESRKRFIKFAEDVQVPFERLERAGLYLFDD